jgi:hypothetical protein
MILMLDIIGNDESQTLRLGRNAQGHHEQEGRKESHRDDPLNLPKPHRRPFVISRHTFSRSKRSRTIPMTPNTTPAMPSQFASAPVWKTVYDKTARTKQAIATHHGHHIPFPSFVSQKDSPARRPTDRLTSFLP